MSKTPMLYLLPQWLLEVAAAWEVHPQVVGAAAMAVWVVVVAVAVTVQDKNTAQSVKSQDDSFPSCLGNI